MSDDVKQPVKYQKFPAYLRHILERRDLSYADAARLCDIGTTVLFRWCAGKRLPKNWDSLSPVAEKLRLTPEEISGLKKAYQAEALGEEQSKCFREIMDTFRVLEEKRIEYNHAAQIGDSNTTYAVQGGGSAPGKYSEFHKLDSKTEVWQCIQARFAALSMQENGSLQLKVRAVSELLMMQLKQFGSSSAGKEMELLVCGSSEAYDSKSKKVKRMKEMLDLLVQKKPVGLYCYDALDELGQTEQNWIVSEDFFIQFTDDMSHGMITTNAEWIAFFRDSFARMKRNSTPFCKKTEGMARYLGSKDAGYRVRTAALEYMPCVSFGLTEEILQEGIYPQAPFREEMIRGILANYPEGVSYFQPLVSYFTEEGLTEFMETGEVEIFPYDVYEFPNRKRRCEILSNTIAVAERESNIHYIMLRKGVFNMKGIHVEQRTGSEEFLNIEIYFEEHEKEVVSVIDKDIRKEYIRFFEYLRDSEYVYSEEETLSRMKKTLLICREKYG